MVKVIEKNYFAALDFRLGMVVAGSLCAIAAFCAVVLGLVSGTVAGLVAGLSPFSLILPESILARRLGWKGFAIVCAPLMFPVFLYALLNSTWVTLRQGGVRWRDTFYALETLRAGTVR